MERSSSKHVVHWGPMVQGIKRNASDLFVSIQLHQQRFVLCDFIGMGTMEWKPSSWIRELWWFWWNWLGLGRKWRRKVWHIKSLRTYSCWRNEPSKYICLVASVRWLSLYYWNLISNPFSIINRNWRKMDILYRLYLHSHILMFKARSFLTIFTCLLLIPGMKSFIILVEMFIPIGSRSTEQLECKTLYSLKKIASTIQNRILI